MSTHNSPEEKLNAEKQEEKYFIQMSFLCVFLLGIGITGSIHALSRPEMLFGLWKYFSLAAVIVAALCATYAAKHLVKIITMNR